MLFTLVINTAPQSLHGGTAYNALRFAQALITQGHSIYRLFFYSEGVLNLSSHAIAPQDEINLCTQWQPFIQTHNIDCVVCIAAAVRRGLLDNNEAKRHNHPFGTLAPNATLSGLGQPIEATARSDRTITFG